MPRNREAKGKLTRRLDPDVQVDVGHGIALEGFASQRHCQERVSLLQLTVEAFLPQADIL